jgi:uncharacterized protein YqgC (DUF456 family)
VFSTTEGFAECLYSFGVHNLKRGRGFLLMLDIIGWIVIILLLIIGMAGAVLPIIPGVIAVLAAFVAYGLFFSFEPFGFWFWSIQIIIAATILLSDYMISVLGVKAFGGSKLSMLFSIVGLIVGPFVIPVVGLVIGPFIGGMIGDWIDKKDW